MNSILYRHAWAAALVLLTSVPASAEVQPEARVAFERMASTLEQAGSLTVRAWTAYDVVQPDGQKLQFHGSVDVQVDRPGRLHASSRKEGTEREVWLRDGQINVVDVGERTWARLVCPSSTIDGMLDMLAKSYGMSMPLADLLYSEVDRPLLTGALAGSDLGTVDVAGVPCRHLAFRGAKADWQFWIEEGERALPRKVVIDYKDSPGQPQYSALLWDWNLAPQLPASVFDFVPPPGASRVTMHPLAAPAKPEAAPVAPASGRGR